ncbi:MAG: hypothetical protein ACOH2M_29675 [Cypionkella sp.]
MLGASKILTVSYGTFSCTLEGFDEPFNTMKAIAEYFRDLAAEDRYFGAEPPTPDAAMLHKIAEREIQRRVEAKIQDNGVILRAGTAEAEPAALPATAPVQPAVSTLPALDTNGESVAARLSRLRAAQAEAERAAAALAEAELAEAELAVAELAAADSSEAEQPAASDELISEFASELAAPTPLVQRLAEATSADQEDYTEDQHAEAIPAELSRAMPDFPAAAQAAEADLYTTEDSSFDDFAEAEEIAAPTLATAEVEAPVAALDVAEETPLEEVAEEQISQAAAEVKAEAEAGITEARAEEEFSEEDSLIASLLDTDPPRTAQDAPGQPAAEPVASEVFGGSESEMASLIASLNEEQTSADAAAETVAVEASYDLAQEADAVLRAAVEQDLAEDSAAEVEQAEAIYAAGLEDQTPEDQVSEDQAQEDLAQEDLAQEDQAQEDQAAEEEALADADAALLAALADPAEVATAESTAEPVTEWLPESMPESAAREDEAEQYSEAEAAPPRARVRVIKVRRALPAGAEQTSAAGQSDTAAKSSTTLSDEAEAALQAELAALEAEMNSSVAASMADIEAEAPAAEPEASEQRAVPEAVEQAAAQIVRPVRPTRPLRPASARPTLSAADDSLSASLEAALAADQTEEAPAASNRHQLGDIAEDDAVSRLIAQTNSAMDGPESRRRSAAIAHLKAAVAATEADRQILAANPPKPQPAPEDIYRSDFESALRPASASAETARKSGERPAPLVLVSEQRIDRIKTEADPATQPRIVRPNRPVRATLSADELGDEDEALSAEEAAANLFAPGQSFADFAESLGAESLHDLLEASAVYCAQVLGRPQFSRPLVMTQINSLPEAQDHALEDQLRAFGTLLREGRITKVKRGAFAVTDRSPLLAEALRNAG